MFNLLLENPFIGVSAALIIFFLILYLREYNKRKEFEERSEQFWQEIKEKGYSSLYQSMKKSQQILGEAELEGIKVVATSRLETSKFEKDYAQKLQQLVDQFAQSRQESQALFTQFIQDLQNRGNQFELLSQKTIQDKVNQLFEKFEQRVSDFLLATEQRTVSSIELELKGARELIETYKSEQFKLIDENIVAMLERTLNIVLSKKLTLKDQLDLIYEALERAKVEKFIV